MTRRALGFLMTLVILVLAYLALWPVPIEPEAWEAPPGRAFVPTGSLEGLQRHLLPDGHGPEDVAVDAEGRVLVGLHDGRILREDGEHYEEVADTEGRPLGLHVSADGALLIADAMRGLLRLDLATGTLEVLATACGGRALHFTDDLETGPDGRIWFTDASVRFRQPDWKLDLIENRPSGRLCVYDPADERVTEVLPSLYFANGVAVDPEGRFVLVNETSRYRVRRLWLTGPEAGTTDVVIDDLPGFPDGISTGADGVFWIAVASPRNRIIDATASWPSARQVIARLPAWVQPAPESTARVMGIRGDGTVVVDAFDPTGEGIHVVTSVQEHEGVLYLGSLVDSAWATLPTPRASPPPAAR